MGRSKEIVKKQLRYKKIGGGSLRIFIGNRRTMIKPGQVFMALPEEIPEAFKDQIKCLENVEVAAPKVNKKVEQVFKVKVRPKNNADPDPGETKKGKKRKWYNVINDKTEKVMNPEPLTESKAKNLVNSLNV